MFNLLIALCLVAMVSTADAYDDWKYVGSSEEPGVNAVLEYDPGATKNMGGGIYRVSARFTKVDRLGPSETSMVPLAVSAVHVVEDLNCGARTAKRLYMQYKMESGMLTERDYDDRIGPRQILRGSMFDSLHSVVCGGRSLDQPMSIKTVPFFDGLR